MADKRRGRILACVNTSWNLVNFREGLLRALVADGFEVWGVAARDEYSDQLATLGVRFVEVPIKGRGTNPLADAALFVRLLAVIRQVRPDVLLGWTVKPNVYGSLAARTLGVPTINNVAGLGTVFTRGGALNAIVKMLYRSSLSGASTVFFQNMQDQAEFIADGLVKEPATRLLPGSGINLTEYCPSPRPVGGPVRFTMISRLLRQKGVEDFVAAAQRLRAERRDVRFALAGPVDPANPDSISPEALARWSGEGTVEVHGMLNDVRPLLAQSDCAVLPSFYREGTPRSLLEAAAMGLPLITTTIPGCRDMVEDDDNGYLVAPRDVEGLVQAMSRIADMPCEERERMGASSRRLAQQRYDERIVIEAYLDAITQAMTRPSNTSHG